jgi:GxxExxY protein
MTENGIAAIIVDSALAVHRELGPGLFESTYEVCLVYELESRGLEVEVQKSLPVVYKNVLLVDAAYRIDLLVNGKVIVELKAVQEITDLHKTQLLSYIRLSKIKLGILINFNVKLIKDGIKRIVNGM